MSDDATKCTPKSVSQDTVTSNSHFPAGITALPGVSSLEIVDTILSLVSIAENSSVKWWTKYNYCENIKDGRGLTVSIVGFCSGTGDLIQVLEALKKLKADHPLVKYIPTVKKVDGSSKTTGLESFAADLKANDDSYWRTAAWTIIQKLYWNPAMEYCSKKGLTSNLSKYIAYDTILNFGDYDGFAKRMTAKTPKDGGKEADWIADFLNAKQAIIEKDRSLGDTKNNRVDMQKALLKSGNLDLKSKMTVKCYGDSFTL